MSEVKELNEKQQLFVFAYIAHNCNGTKAYQEVYECDLETAMTNSSRLLRNAKVKERINKEIDILLGDKQSLALQVVNEYKKIAFSDIKEFVDPETGKVNCNENTDSSALESYESKVVYIEEMVDGNQKRTPIIVPKYKMYDKQRALDSLSRFVVGFTEKKDITIEKLDELVEELRKR